MGELGFRADDSRMEISVNGGKKIKIERRHKILGLSGVISAGFRGIFGVEVETPCYVDRQKDGW